MCVYTHDSFSGPGLFQIRAAHKLTPPLHILVGNSHAVADDQK